METLIINVKSEKEKSLFFALAEQLHLKAAALSEEDKEDYGLLKAMMKGKKGDYVSKQSIMKALRK